MIFKVKVSIFCRGVQDDRDNLGVPGCVDVVGVSPLQGHKRKGYLSCDQICQDLWPCHAPM